MRTAAHFAILGIFLTACSPTSYSGFSKSGVSRETASRDGADSKVLIEAFTKVKNLNDFAI